METEKRSFRPVPAIVLLVLLCGIMACSNQAKKDSTTATSDLTWSTSSEEALTEFQKGLLYIDAGDFFSGMPYFKKALELDPNFAMAYVYRSFGTVSYEEFANDIKLAASYIDKVTEPEKLLIQINQTFTNSDSEKHLQLAKKLTELKPELARSWVELGNAHQRRNEVEQAREAYTKAKNIDANWIGVTTALGVSYTFVEPTDFEKGRDYLAKTVELQPELAITHINLGDAHRALDDLDNALAEYSKAIELTPENDIAYFKRGHINTFTGQFDEARMDYALARKYTDFSDQGYVLEGLTYLYEGKPEKCLEWIEGKAEEIEKLAENESRKRSGKLNCANTCSWIAFHHNKPEHLARAVEMRNKIRLEMAYEIGDPGDERDAKAQNLFWNGLEAALANDLGKADKLAEENKVVIESNTDPLKLNNYHFLKGYIAYVKGEYELAAEHFDQTNPNWQYGKYYLAKSYEAAEEMDKAIALYKEIAVFNFNTVAYALVRNEMKEKLATL